MKEISGYNEFIERSTRTDIDLNEKLGFYNLHRNANEKIISEHIWFLLGYFNLNRSVKILDIGSGGSELSRQILNISNANDCNYIINDSEEIISQSVLKNYKNICTGRFPDVLNNLKKDYGSFDVILCYSVWHYIRNDNLVNVFFEAAKEILNGGGLIFLGDVPILEQKLANSHSNHSREINVKNAFSYSEIQDYLKVLGNEFSLYISPQPRSLTLSPHRSEILFYRHKI